MGCGRSAAMDDLLKHVNESEKKVVFLENCHNLFVRQVDGFDALYDLHHLLSFSRNKVFWVAGWNPYTWYFLDKTIGFNQFFDKTITFRALDDERIIQWLQHRHDSTGFTIEFKGESGDRIEPNGNWLPEGYKSSILAGANGNIKTSNCHMAQFTGM